MKRSSVHKVGWVRVSPRFPGKAQLEALKAAGCHAIYSTADDETLEDLYRHLRRDNHLHVLGLHRLGSTRAELEATLRLCHETGVVVHDLEVGGVVDLSCFTAAISALGIINGEVRMAGPELARKRRGYRGGRKLKQGPLPDSDAKAAWHDVAGIRTDGEAAALIGLGLRTLYRRYGPSGRKAGWPKRK